MSPEPHTIALLHEHTLLRRGMAKLLGELGPHRILAEVGDAAAFKRAFALGNVPDVLVLSVEAAMADHCAFLHWCHKHMACTRLLLTGQEPDTRSLLRTLCAGAHGFFSSRKPPEELCRVLEELLHGAIHYPAEVMAHLLELLPALEEPTPDLDKPISTNQRIFLRWLVAAGGLSYPDIAERMGVTTSAVEKYGQKLCKRFRLKGKSALVKLAMDLGLHLEPQPARKKKG